MVLHQPLFRPTALRAVGGALRKEVRLVAVLNLLPVTGTTVGKRQQVKPSAVDTILSEKSPALKTAEVCFFIVVPPENELES